MAKLSCEWKDEWKERLRVPKEKILINILDCMKLFSKLSNLSCINLWTYINFDRFNGVNVYVLLHTVFKMFFCRRL